MRRGPLTNGDIGELERLLGRRRPEGLLHDQHAPGIRRRGRRQGAALEAQDEPVTGDLELLRRCVADQRLRVGEEEGRADGARIQPLGVDLQRQPVRGDLHAGAPGRGLRQGPARGIEGSRRRCVRRSGDPGGGNGQGERQARLARDAFLLAHQPGDVGFQRDRRGAVELGRRRDAGEQCRFALVAEVGEVRDGDALRRRPCDRPGFETRRQLPGDARRLARVARIAPVDVPVVLDAQAQPDPERLARLHRRRLGNELCLDQVRGRRRRGVGGVRPARQQCRQGE